ncbi:MAG: sulfite exporter TauE/SafE family protein [Parachlamydiaceae bacterium]|nr:sulfite exporter TauE/SafE family protein [Parachlamydiaceae bacterium]
MTLFLSLLPLYLLGNLHCIGMCGPLVMMLGQHRYRYFYFFGRLLSFTLAGLLAGGLGAVLNLILYQYHISLVSSFLFGGLILLIGCYSLFGWQYPAYSWLAKRLERTNQRLSLLLLRDNALATFVFGFFTITLPCGQTLIVFSACALSGNVWVGMFNGFAFALLTSPALVLAMHAHLLFRRLKRHYNVIMGCCAILVGGLAICRGLAELDWIEHWVLNPHSQKEYHIVIY